MELSSQLRGHPAQLMKYIQKTFYLLSLLSPVQLLTYHLFYPRDIFGRHQIYQAIICFLA